MSKEFINLEQVVKDWAMQEFKNTSGPSQMQLLKEHNKRKCIDMQIDWSKMMYSDITTWVREDAIDPKMDISQQAKQSVDPAESTMTILFETKFLNKMKDPLEYTMQTQKKTKSSMNTVIDSGLMTGGQVGLKLKIPLKVFEENAGFKREVTLTNVEGDLFEEELVWGVNSLIRVLPGHMAEASLVVDEKKRGGEFVIETSISGWVYVTFTNLKENNAFVKAMGGDISAIVGEYLVERKGGQEPNFIHIDNKVVKVQTKGSCKFHYGVSHRIIVSERPLAPDDI